jgi:methylphosphotriester-DNA--protein-cysteine methyltransferase
MLVMMLLGPAAHAQSGKVKANDPVQAWITQRKEWKQQGYKFVGNVKSNKFHRIDCRWAKRCTRNCRIPFKTREQAIEMEFVPCKVCKP